MPSLHFVTVVPRSADLVWQAVCTPKHLMECSKPLLRFEMPPPLPVRFLQGQTLNARLFLFGFIPWSRHSIHFTLLDDSKRCFETREFGGGIRGWIHRSSVEALTPMTSICRDDITFEAGLWNPLVWAFGQVFYRWRAHRRSQLLGR